MNHLELFAGIGGFRRALELLEQDRIMEFKSVGFSEIDTKAVTTYKVCYNLDKDETEFGDIVKFTADKNNILSLKPFNLLTAGFPCQAFSMMGHQKGFDEDRGQMFFRIVDILTTLGERKPKYLLLENVKNLYTHDKKRSYKRIKTELENLGYTVYDDIFNTSDFCLPQNRNRLYIFATSEKILDGILFNFSAEAIKHHFKSKIQICGCPKYNNVLDILSKCVDDKYYLSDKIKPTILSDGSKGYKSNSEINLLIARPLTASMHKMHRACQDNYFSKRFIESSGKVNDASGMSKEDICKLSLRRITLEEAFMLQGFPKDFVQKAKAAGVNDGSLYKQAGNAVSVNVIYAIILYLIDNKVIKDD